MNKKHITNEELREAINNPENQEMVKKVCAYYANTLSPATLKACSDAAIWRCLQSHEDNKGQKFTSSLYRFLHWECLREVNMNKKRFIAIPEDIVDDGHDPFSTIILEEYLNVLSEEAKKIIIDRYIENRTLSDIGNRYNYSKQGIQNIIMRSMKTMREYATQK